MNGPEVPDFPGRPSEIPHTVPLVTLAERYSAHRWPLLRASAGVGSLSPAELAAHTLAALAFQAALADRAQAGRWVTARDALAAGADLAAVAAAMDLDVDAVAVGLREWADGQRAYGWMSDAEHKRVTALATRVVCDDEE
ncbi:MAG: hypothetical protein GEU83_03220 [Pseudonocardiaceae bacterium]|nr:hypothetical protein [Pseudonocardiaceae bacterium]